MRILSFIRPMLPKEASTAADVAFLKQELEAERRLHRETVTSLKAMTLNRDALDESMKAARLMRDHLEKRNERLTGQIQYLTSRVQSLSESVLRMEAGGVLHDETAGRLTQELSVARDRLSKLDKGALAKREKAVALREANLSEEGPKRVLEKENDAQAARAMSRQTKTAFVEYQKGVTFLLDRLNELGKKNHITKEDLRHFHDIRRDLSAQLQRTI